MLGRLGLLLPSLPHAADTKTESEHSVSQQDTCEKFGSIFDPPAEDAIVGVAVASLGQLPLNAMRSQPHGAACGWYVWGGDFSDAPDFFEPLHVQHLAHYAPALVPYLALTTGWRVQLASDHVDVWYDDKLLAV